MKAFTLSLLRYSTTYLFSITSVLLVYLYHNFLTISLSTFYSLSTDQFAFLAQLFLMWKMQPCEKMMLLLVHDIIDHNIILLIFYFSKCHGD